MTAQSAKRFKVMLMGAKNDLVELKAYYPLLGWKFVTVSKDYKVQELSKDEQEEMLEQGVIKKPSTPKTIPGKVSGLGWRATWFKWIKEVGQDVHTGREAVIEKMLLEFPHREVTIKGMTKYFLFKYNKGELIQGKKPAKVYWKLEKHSMHGNNKKRWPKKQTDKQEITNE